MAAPFPCSGQQRLMLCISEHVPINPAHHRYEIAAPAESKDGRDGPQFPHERLQQRKVGNESTHILLWRGERVNVRLQHEAAQRSIGCQGFPYRLHECSGLVTAQDGDRVESGERFETLSPVRPGIAVERGVVQN